MAAEEDTTTRTRSAGGKTAVNEAADTDATAAALGADTLVPLDAGVVNPAPG